MNRLNKILSVLCVVGMIFAQNPITVSGELSTTVTLGDTMSFDSPYTGLTLSGEGWHLSSQLSEGAVVVEEASYNIDANFASLTLGKQRMPFGLTVPWHRPGSNPYVSEPSTQTYSEGIGVSVELLGIGVEAFVGNDKIYSTRLSYGVLGHSAGVSADNNDRLLVDVNGTTGIFIGSLTSYFEYDLSEETSGDFWYRAVIAPEFTKGVSALVGYSSTDDETDTMYGVGYQYGNAYLRSELSAEGDVSIRVSYSF